MSIISIKYSTSFPHVHHKISARSLDQPNKTLVLWNYDVSKHYSYVCHSIVVELAPPLLNMNVKEDVIHVSATFPMAICVESLSWMYDLNFWKAGSEDKVSKRSTV